MAESTADEICAGLGGRIRINPGASTTFPTGMATSTTSQNSVQGSDQSGNDSQLMLHASKDTTDTNQLSSQEVTIQDNTDPKTHIRNLPYEMVALIFQKLQLGSANCLGLTCRSLYNCLKTYHLDPIPLDCHTDLWNSYRYTSHIFCHCNVRNGRTKHQHELSCVIAGWLGPDYRFAQLFPPCPTSRYKFLNKKVYGDFEEGCSSDSKERLLQRRYDDWELSLGHYNKAYGYLPSPYNLGDDWYDILLPLIIGGILESARIDRQDCTSDKLRDQRSWCERLYLPGYRAGKLRRLFGDLKAAEADEAIEDIRYLGL